MPHSYRYFILCQIYMHLGVSILPKDAARDWTTSLPINSWPSLPPELQPSGGTVCSDFMVSYSVYCAGLRFYLLKLKNWLLSLGSIHSDLRFWVNKFQVGLIYLCKPYESYIQHHRKGKVVHEVEMWNCLAEGKLVLHFRLCSGPCKPDGPCNSVFFLSYQLIWFFSSY